MEATQIADGLRVLEIGSGAAGSLAGMILADNGADVIKVEAPGGDPLRDYPGFAMWNRGKRRITADLSETSGREPVLSLARGADVLISTLKPGASRRFGMEWSDLERGCPALVHCHITGFGRSGPWAEIPGRDSVVMARSGRMAEFKQLADGRRPAYVGVPFASYGASQLALHGILAALLVRERSGRGQAVETSLFQALSVFDIVNWLPGNPMVERIEDSPWLPYTVACTADGIWIQFAQLSRQQYRAFIHALDLDEIWETDRFRRAPHLRKAEDLRALRAILLERVRERPWAEWRERFDRDRHLAVEVFQRPNEAMRHPQIVHNGDVVQIDDPRRGRTRQLGPIARFARTPSRIVRPASASAESGPVGWRGSRKDTPPPSPLPDGGRPLAGLLVLELATWIATPLSASLLADLGARVIKIEPLSGDPIRQVAGAHLKTVQGKESIALDLKKPEARGILLGLVERADVLIHNYRPGVPERLGIDAASCLAANPRLIHLHGASYGSSGPCADKPAYHPSAGALCGAALTMAGEGIEQPTPGAISAPELARLSRMLEISNESHPDPNAGLASATAILLALYERARSGRGQAVETRMMASNLYALYEHTIDFEGATPPSPVDAERWGRGALERLYACASGWALLSAPRAHEFERLCRALGRGEWQDDPRFASAESRAHHDAALAKEIAAVLASADAASWQARLLPEGIACVEADGGPFARVAQREPFAREAGTWSAVAEGSPSSIGPYERYGPTVSLSGDRPRLGGPCELGEQTREILREQGVPDDHIERLHQAGVISSSPNASERGRKMQ